MLQRLHIPFEIIPSHLDETPLPGESPIEMVQRLAEQKARAVATPNALIIGADQVGVLENEILCKPLTRENALEQLQRASGKRVRFLIGLCLLDTRNDTTQIVLETFDVVFRQLSLEMIETYLEKEDALQCAGSFKAEGMGVTLVDEFDGKDFSALIGLPLIRLTRMLETAGFSPLKKHGC